MTAKTKAEDEQIKLLVAEIDALSDRLEANTAALAAIIADLAAYEATR